MEIKMIQIQSLSEGVAYLPIEENMHMNSSILPGECMTIHREREPPWRGNDKELLSAS
jgi:hypothetical protein